VQIANFLKDDPRIWGMIIRRDQGGLWQSYVWASRDDKWSWVSLNELNYGYN
jgi:hypothetical protein